MTPCPRKHPRSGVAPAKVAGGGKAALTLAAAAVGGVAIEAGDAAVAVASGCQALTLFTHALVHTLAVAVTLAR